MWRGAIALPVLLLSVQLGILCSQSRKAFTWGDQGEGSVLKGSDVWFRGINNGDTGRLFYSLDGATYTEAGKPFRMVFRFWKGGRIAIFSYGPNGGSADFDYVRYRYAATTETLGLIEARVPEFAVGQAPVSAGVSPPRKER